MKRLIPLTVIVMFLGLSSCDQNDYLVDGGLAEEEVGMSTMNFLESHQELDTLAILIERSGYGEEVNGEVTLFAPNNLSINNYIDGVLAEMRETDPQAEYTLDDIPNDTLEKYMGGYIFTEIIKRGDLTEQGEIYTALNGDERRLSLEPTNEYGGQLSERPEYVFYTYKGGEEFDESNNITDDTKVRIRTSNLVSSNGVIHVLQGNHTLFNWEDPDN